MVSFTDHYNAISIDRFSSKTKIGIDSWKIFTKIILLCKPQPQRLLFFITNTKKQKYSASDWWGYTKYCFKENARTFLTVPPLKRILQFQENICLFFLKKQQPLQQVPDGETANLVLKRMLELFLKVLPLKKLEIQNQKKDYKICIKRKFQTKN